MFELHAGSANKRPPEYVFLENGSTLRDVMNACVKASLDSREEFVRNAIGCSTLRKSTICLKCRGFFYIIFLCYNVYLHVYMQRKCDILAV